MTSQQRRRRTTMACVGLFVAIAGIAAAVVVPRLTDDEPVHVLAGHVVDLQGRPIEGAVVSTEDASTVSDSVGAFELRSARARAWIRTQHASFLPRTRAASTSAVVVVRMTPDDGRTASLTFGGDVMFGRRFFDRDEDGRPGDGVLEPGDGAGAHLELLEGVLPLLEDSDVTIVNLESPLIADPFVERDAGIEAIGDRDQRFHPTKEFVFASSVGSAEALATGGVDVVGLGNNHLFDALEGGLLQTLDALDGAGFERGSGRTGAGTTDAAAWEPAVVTARGQSIAVLACTTITGDEHAVRYVADDRQAGAAECTPAAIGQHVSAARRGHDLVVMMIHGGFEYDPEPSPRIRSLSETARRSGAGLVINHHPHVVGGLDFDGQGLIAWTMGNLVFDQTIWPTFASYLLTVNVRDGQVVSAHADPLLISDFVPAGATDAWAERVTMDALARSTGPFGDDGGTVVLVATEDVTVDERTDVLAGDPVLGAIHDAPRGWRYRSIDPSANLDFGRELVGVGGFEDVDTRTEDARGALWAIEGSARSITPEAAAAGGLGARLDRVAGNRTDAVLTTLHRILVEPGGALTASGLLRLGDDADVTIQLSWFPDTRGPSDQQTLLEITRSGAEWTPFRLDAVVPDSAVAVGLIVRLAPPGLGRVSVDVDDIELIEWAPLCEGACRHVRVRTPSEVVLVRERFPGADSDLAP